MVISKGPPGQRLTLPGALAGTLKDRARCVWTSLKMVDCMHVPLSAGSFKYKVSVTGFIALPVLFAV